MRRSCQYPCRQKRQNLRGFQYNGSTYYYGRNLQGDVVELYQNGALVGKYEYDAWGAIESITDASGNAITSASNAAMVNPFRYRGYYYDEETGFYYLHSRYYDPVVKRFINADTTEVITQSPQAASYDKNLFTYCDNNPVIRKDNGGEFWLQLGAAILGGIVGAVCEVANQVIAGEEINWTSVGIEAAAGAATGVLMSEGVPAAVVTAGWAFINGSASVAHSINQGDDFGITVAKASASMRIAYVSGMKYNKVHKVQDSGVLGKMGKVGSTVEKFVNKAVENPGQVLQTAGTVIADVTQNQMIRSIGRLGLKLLFSKQRYTML